jgi:hypothetical protein
MKKSKAQKTLDKNSLVMRNLVRHKLPPPCFAMKDRKRESDRKSCRKNNDI